MKMLIWLLLLLLALLLIILISYVFTVQERFKPILTNAGYINIDNSNNGIYLSPTPDTKWKFDPTIPWIYGYNNVGIKCMSNINTVGVSECEAVPNQSFIVTANRIRIGESCLRNDGNSLYLGSCDGALTIL